MREVEICNRLAEARRQHGLTRIVFAHGLMPDPMGLTRIELGRVPLYYQMARKIWQKLSQLNPVYLATGEGPVRLDFEIWLPPIEDIGATAGELFSSVFDRFETELRTLTGPEEMRILPAAWIPAQRFYLDYKRLKIKQAQAELAAQAKRVANFERATQSYKKKKARGTQMDVNEVVNKSIVKSQLEDLLEDVRKQTVAPGCKTALAKYLRLPLASVSQWLSGSRKPDGENALKIKKWMDDQKGK